MLKLLPIAAITVVWLGFEPASPGQDGGYPNGNTAEGGFALAEIINHPSDSGFDNVAIGFAVLQSDNSGSHNTGVGTAALANNDVGNDNTATGNDALLDDTSGVDNTANGSEALSHNVIGSNNTAIGFQALDRNTASNNTATGFDALLNNVGGTLNTASGYAALSDNTSGSNNTASGANALVFNSGGSRNTAVGFSALENNNSGSNNVGIGYLAGQNLTSGSNNIDIGANVSGPASEANTIRIGKQGTQKSTFVAGIAGTAATGSTVVVSSTGKLGVATSSARFKEQIKPMDKASEAVLALKPVTFRYKEEVDPGNAPQFGLVAEDVEKVSPDLVIHDDQGKPFTVRYEAVNAMLLNEFLKEHRKVEEQSAAIAKLNNTIAQQTKNLERLTVNQQKDLQALTAQCKEQSAQIAKLSAEIETGNLTRRVAAIHP